MAGSLWSREELSLGGWPADLQDPQDQAGHENLSQVPPVGDLRVTLPAHTVPHPALYGHPQRAGA